MECKMVEDYLHVYPWVAPSNNTITVQQALLGATELDYDSVITTLADANKVVIDVPKGCVSMELRFFGDTSAAENTDDVVELYAHAPGPSSHKDHFRHFAQLTITIGTQDYGSSYHFHDTVAPASEAWITTPAEVSPGNNTFGSYSFNTHGHDKILVIASDLDVTTLGVEYRRH